MKPLHLSQGRDFALIRARTAWRHSCLALWHVALLGAALSVAAAFALYYWEYRLAYAQQFGEYERKAEERVGALQGKLDHALEQIRSLAALFDASDSITADEFHVFSRILRGHEPSLLALKWAPRVSNEKRAEYEAARQREVPGFAITEQGAQGGMQPAADRAEYFPVQFIEPYQGNEAALGFDVASEPLRREALSRARDGAVVAASGLLELVQRPDGNPSVLILAPVYAKGAAPASVEQRRLALRGFVLGAFGIGALVERAFDPLDPAGIDIWIYDAAAAAGHRLLHWHRSRKSVPRPVTDIPQPPESDFLRRTFIELAGRRWSVVQAPARGCYLPVVSPTPWAVLLAGLAITGLLAVHLGSLRTHAAKLAHQAHHDNLTGLPNRYLLQDRLEQVLHQAERRERSAALVLVDLDHFKDINDSLGHHAGDRLLQVTAQRLCACVRESDTVARPGGDEFMLVLAISEGQDEERVLAVVKRVLDRVSQPLQLDCQEVVISCSIGIGLYPRDGSDPHALFKNADAAMYRAKAEGGNGFCFYQAEMNARARERLSLQVSLRRALERNELRLHYQPQVKLDSARIVAVEALLRWDRPDQGLIAPAQFVPLAEESGLIVAIGEWVLRAACAQARSWQRAGLPAVRVAVNLSARQFRCAGLVPVIARTLAENGLEARDLELELTESLLMENTEEAAAILAELKAMGVKVSIDDFGTGYSSLGYLTRFPLDRVKIDRSFVRNLPAAADDAAIARAVIGMAHSLRLQAVAEGVETEAQLAFLRGQGCDEAQGYYFSPPLPADKMAALLSRHGGPALGPTSGECALTPPNRR